MSSAQLMLDRNTELLALLVISSIRLFGVISTVIFASNTQVADGRERAPRQ